MIGSSDKTLDDLAAKCIRCGFCIEACPTFLTTGLETESPRGRIYLIRSALAGKLRWGQIQEHLDHCLGCRACEMACPSAVEYGTILELARSRQRPGPAVRTLLEMTSSPNRLKVQIALAKLLPGRKIPSMVGRLISPVPQEARVPIPQALATWQALDESALPAIRGEVLLLEGCAMRVLFPRVHQATRRLLRRSGYVVRETDLGCCGSLHAHIGMLDDARLMAEKLAATAGGDLPIIVNSAGCGSTMKEYGWLTSGDLGKSVASRTYDLSEFLVRERFCELLREAPGLDLMATYHDACHLAHGQKIRLQPRQLLESVPGLKLVPLPESDVCCGSAGIYNFVQPHQARLLLDRKWENIEGCHVDLVVMGNPGCHAWIEQAAREHGNRPRVMHLAEILECAWSGLPELSR